MTTMPPRPHDRYEELVAGFALSALEPADEQDLLRHMAGCAACERSLTEHLETLGHLAYAVDDGPPPAGLWDAIRSEVEAQSGPAAFAPPAVAPSTAATGSAPVAPPAVTDLSVARAARAERTPRRWVGWASAAAGIAVVATLGYGITASQRGQSREDQVAAAVQAIETAPARTVPLTGADGKVSAVAVLSGGHVSLIVDGLKPNDTASSVYVLWGQTGNSPARALATFDVRDGSLAVVKDVPTTAGGQAEPQILAITHEPGRTAPAATVQPKLARGRAA
jgi:hypothetical protein